MPLLTPDEEFLKENGYDYQVHEVANLTLLVIKGYHLPNLYTPNIVDLLVKIPPGYPVAAMDMFWVYPEVLLVAGNCRPPATDHFEDNLGQRWQRFSRHYQWRPGVDSLQSHLLTVNKALKKVS